MTMNNDFYVVAREPGAENLSLPTWANHRANPINLDVRYANSEVTRKEIPEVPGAFQLLNVLSKEECQRFIEISESLGYLKDAAVSLPREIRHNDNITWVTDETTDQLIWERVKHLANNDPQMFDQQKAVGINARFRFYRYDVGDYFKSHIDGAWPGSRVIDEKLIHNAYPDQYSQMTFLILLNEDFVGGATRFLVNADDPSRPARDNTSVKQVDIHTPSGGVLCFPHGHHPLQCVHGSQAITEGTKYIIRTDMLFREK